MDEDGLKQALVAMLGGNSYPIDTGSFQNDMTTFKSNDDILTLLVHLGYLAYDETAKLSCIEEYQEIQELPSGTGYADIIYLPRKNSSKPILLFELKWNKTKESAIRQIKERNYPQVLEGYGGDILLVGINYDANTKKHTCQIEKHQRKL